MESIVPKLDISTAEIDLKDISANAKVSRTVIFSNSGKETLHIRKIATNCSCVQTELKNNKLEPGEITDLKFTFDPKGRKGIDHKHISVFSNDPLNPVRTIVVRSTVK
jgi:uncharacterized secreted protein with C-terminal beta-propeller domain